MHEIFLRALLSSELHKFQKNMWLGCRFCAHLSSPLLLVMFDFNDSPLLRHILGTTLSYFDQHLNHLEVKILHFCLLERFSSGYSSHIPQMHPGGASVVFEGKLDG